MNDLTGFVHAHPARPPGVPVRGAEGDREGELRAGGQGLRPQGAPPRGRQDGAQREALPQTGM